MMKPYSKEEAIRYIEKFGLCVMKPSNADRFISCGFEAFKDYTIYKYFFNEKSYDKKVMIAIESLVKINGSKGILYSDSEEVNGFAQWFPPGFVGHSSFDYVLSGSWKLMFLPDFWPSIKRCDIVEGFSFKRKAQITQNQDIFLYNFAVRPSMQGKGIARKLVKPMLEYAKAINRPCYCETYDPKNVAIYKHLGFTDLEPQLVPNTSVTHYPMLFKVD
ncbi:hypothetical protein M9Y10_019562 [Tritrichomonas musculus]|uniref:N-acetyltransferase domain-containing protein n=1 Tax=Tritrichomonas musculus TaxID=1915356 RepID=A0ABR2HGU0_9EUKA